MKKSTRAAVGVFVFIEILGLSVWWVGDLTRGSTGSIVTVVLTHILAAGFATLIKDTVID